MVWIFIALLVLSLPRFNRPFEQNFNFDLMLKILLMFMALLSLVSYGAYTPSKSHFYWAGIFFQTVTLWTTLLFFVNTDSESILKRLAIWRVPLFLTAIILAKLMIILDSPVPGIDVFHFVTGVGQNLIHGINPYGSTYKFPGGIFNHFTYLPFSFLATLPFKMMFGDIRYAYIAFDLISAFGLYLLAAKAFAGTNQEHISTYVPLLFLANPIHGFLLNQAWVEPIMVTLLVLFAVSFQYNSYRFSGWTAILIGLLFATKQYIFISAPLLLRIKGWRVRHILIAAFTAIIIIAPFYLWSPSDFKNGIIYYFIENAPRYDSATILSLLHNDFNSIDISLRSVFDNKYISYSVIMLPASLAFIMIFWTQTNTLNSFFVALASLLLAFFLFSKMSFANYDYLISSMLLTAIVARSRPN